MTLRTPENFIDVTLQATNPRLIIKPTADPTTGGITILPNDDGTFDVTLSWSYTQGITPASGFIIYVTKSLSTPTVSNSSAFYVPIDSTSYTFSNVNADTDLRAGIAAYVRISDLDYVGNIISPISWEMIASTPNYQGNIGGTPASAVQTLLNYTYNFQSSMLDDGIVSPLDKRALRTDWDNLFSEKTPLLAQATALNVSVVAYANAFIALSTWLNGGSAWVTASPPLYIDDAHIQTSTTLSSDTITTLRTLLTAVVTERMNLLSALHAKAATRSTWEGTSNIPSQAYNNNDAEKTIGNINFSDWPTGQPLPTGWLLYGSDASGISQTSSASLVKIGSKSLVIACSSGVQKGISKRIDIKLSKNFIISGTLTAQLTRLTSGDANKLPSIYLIAFGASGLISATASQSFIESGIGWQSIPFTFRGDGITDVVAIEVYLLGNTPATNFIGTVVFDNIEYKIQDGAIFDNKKQQMSDVKGAIDTSTTSGQLLNLSITGGKIDNLTVSGGKLQDYTLGPNKFAVSSLAAITADLGTINAGNYTGSGYIDIEGQASVSGYTASAVFNKNSIQTTGVFAKGSSYAIVGATTSTGGIGITGTSSGALSIGVYGVNSSTGYGVAGESTYGYGGYFRSSSSYSLYVNGTMWIASSAQVSNLNASFLANHPASDFSLTSHTHTNFIQRIFATGNTTYTSYSSDIQFHTTVSGYQFVASGNVVTFIATSDSSLKTNINPETYGLDFINSLLPSTYRLKADPTYIYHGFIADDIHALDIPENDILKITYPDGLKGFDPNAIIAILTKAVQELSTKVTLLEAQINP